MKIRELKIRNFRGIEEMNISLDSQLNVFCGINGVGKSSILDSIALQLSWIIARIRTGKGSGRPIAENSIKNGENSSKIELLVEDNNNSYTGILVKHRKGRFSNEKSSMAEFSNYTKSVQQDITTSNEPAPIPVFIYYSTNRVVKDIPLRIRGKHEFNLLETYDNSLETGVTFQSFFEWYRNREDLENEQFREANHKYSGDKQLKAVRSAILAISGFDNISVKRNPLHMEIIKENEKLSVEQLSDGEKCLFAMAGDMARRLSIANPFSIDPLKGEGVVLIDEIDLHLHPGWQRQIISKLLKTFPNIQFIISTHSPQILGEVQGDKIFILYQNEDKNISYYKPEQAIGLSSSEILEFLMDTNSVNELVKTEIEKIFEFIDNDKFKEANKLIEKFKRSYGTVPDITRAETLITMYSDEDE